MNLTISCPDCQRPLRVPEDLLGHAVKCPSCSHTFVAPENVEETPNRRAETPQNVDYGEGSQPFQHRANGEEHDVNYDDSMRHSRLPPAKPGKVQAIASMVLAGGIFACIWTLGWTPISGFACCLWPGAYYGLVLGIMAIVKGANLLGDKAYRLPPPQGIAIMMIINIINADTVNLVLGIIILVFLSDEEVKAYFRR